MPEETTNYVIGVDLGGTRLRTALADRAGGIVRQSAVPDRDETLLGTRGGAAEIGHMTIEINGPRCACGNHGCLEAMASGTAIAREARRRLDGGASSTLAAGERATGAEPLSAEEVV